MPTILLSWQVRWRDNVVLRRRRAKTGPVSERTIGPQERAQTIQFSHGHFQ